MCSTRQFVEAIRAARRDTPAGATLSRIPLDARGVKAGDTLIVNAAVVPLRKADDAERRHRSGRSSSSRTSPREFSSRSS